MNFIEAYKAMLEGKKVRRLSSFWNKDAYIHMPLKLCNNITDEDGNNYEFSTNDYIYGWEVYKKQEELHTFEEAIAAYKEELHTFEEAIAAYKEGKLIIRDSEPLYKYRLSSGTDLYYTQVIKFTNLDILANDWIILDKEVIK